MINLIFSDIGDISRRLFDHRPFFDGEINFFLEFEETKGNNDIENLLEIIQKTTESKISADKCKLLSEKHLKTNLRNSQTILNSLKDILYAEKHQPLGEVLAKNSETRKKLWKEFLMDEEFKKSRTDHAFEQKKEELTEFYLDLEQKLNIHS